MAFITMYAKRTRLAKQTERRSIKAWARYKINQIPWSYQTTQACPEPATFFVFDIGGIFSNELFRSWKINRLSDNDQHKENRKCVAKCTLLLFQ